MKRKITLSTFLLSILFLASCSKSIEGQVNDNFGNPLKDVSVTIEGTQFQSTTNNNGHFELDYAPGQFLVKFESDDYITEGKELNITEKQKYPLEAIELVRKPSGKSFYVQIAENPDYIEIPTMKFGTTKAKKKSIYTPNVSSKIVIEKPDAVFVIKTKALDKVKIYDWTKGNWKLASPTRDWVVGNIDWNLTMEYVKLTQPLKGSAKTHPSKAFKTREWAFEYGKVYAFVNIKEGSFSNTLQSYTGYLLKFEEE